MKVIFVFSLFCVVVFSGCSLRQREMELNKRIAEVNEKEQQLFLKEQSLNLKEAQLNEMVKLLDSTSKKIANDSLALLYPQLPGDWNVKMQAIETNCPGSAMGDTKNEIWNFKYQGNNIIVSVISNNKLVRIYTGSFSGNAIRLSLQQDSTNDYGVIMNVLLQRVNENEMEGKREIIQSSGCHIIYSLELKKRKQ